MNLKNSKLGIFLSLLISSSVFSCSNYSKDLNLVNKISSNNIKDFSDLEKEYSKFTTKALSESYLLRKINKLISEGNGAKILKELQYAQYKGFSKVPFDSIISNSSEPSIYYANLVNFSEIVNKRISDSAFDSFIASLSPSGSISPTNAITFASSRSGHTNIFVMNSDGSSQSRLTQNTSSNIDYYEPNFSPDKSKTAFVIDNLSNSNINVINKDGTGLTQLTNNSYFNSKPVWSHDGQKIAYQSDKSGGRLFIINKDGTNPIEVSSITSVESNSISWSLDNTKIFFTGNDGDEEIYQVNADGSNLVKLTDNTSNDNSPSLSPDGNTIAFISDRDGGDDDIFTMTITGASQTNRTASSSDNESMINWSPDSSKISFQYDFDNQFDIYTIDSDGTNRTNLTNNASDDYSPYWIDSSNIVFVSTRDSNREIYKVNISNLTETNISNNTSEDSLISAFAGMQ